MKSWKTGERKKNADKRKGYAILEEKFVRMITTFGKKLSKKWIRLISLIEMKGFVYSAWDDPNLCVEEIDRLSVQMYPVHRTKE